MEGTMELRKTGKTVELLINKYLQRCNKDPILVHREKLSKK